MYTNRFISNAFSIQRKNTPKKFSFSASTTFKVVENGVLMDGYYRDPSEKHSKGGREKHLGVDITGPTDGGASVRGKLNDPRRGLPVYSCINTIIPINDLNQAKVFNKTTNSLVTGVGIQGTGNAEMIEAKIKTQPWKDTSDHAYGGIVGFHCYYRYNNLQGTRSEFTAWIEFLHLITDEFPPRYGSSVATKDEWNALGRGNGWGPEIKNNAVVPPSFFQGPIYSIIGYLGATQSPHVHVQVAFHDGHSNSMQNTIRIDPLIFVY
ncbi:MAG: hypothetical protein K1X55_03300 [Chitinophagales bacterium]|nr:hypothetical protein [Chitinophagales bacterium]